ncbi:exopolysaccharide transport family protein [Rhizomicrobium palustre]|uniref:non-specific protein-tyrosine kinase n=1 Tax=Rhizomicrobium palustre TaxID=189966 RepID=A0A846MZI4_9PROT|nr:exopolysaccharide transport family protein [Rhizomicrobium palustre]
MRRKIILGTAAIVVALVTVAVMEMTPLYTATAVVMLDQRKHNLEDSVALFSGLPADQSTIQNQIQILTSLELGGRVVDKEKLRDDPEFNPARGALPSFLSTLNPAHWFGMRKTEADAQQLDAERSAVIHRFLDRVSVSQIGLSTAMNVSFRSDNPRKAARLAAAIANAYVEDQLEAKFQATQKATQWLSGRISNLSKEAQLADAAVQQYKAEHNITTTANGVSVVDQQIADINGKLVAARTEMAELQANYDRLLALAKNGKASDSAQVLASPLIANLRAQETQLTSQMANLASKYGPRHPKMLDLEAQRQTLSDKINEEIQRFVSSAKNDVDVASSHVASLEASLRQAEAQGAGQNQANVQLTALQSAATSARAMYEAFLGRLNQTQGQEGIQTPDARIISNPEVPGAPSSPKKELAIGLSIPAGLVLGFILALIIERLDIGFRTTAELERLMGVPVLATVPEVELLTEGETPVKAADLISTKPLSAFAEAVRGLQLGLSLSNVDDSPKVILVSSSVPGEGKTTISLSLARSAARGGLTAVIVDGDLRRPTVAKAVGLTDIQNGIVETLAGKASLTDCLYKDPLSNALVLPCSSIPASPTDVLSSKAMQGLVARLRDAFDLVIIDTAPLLPVNDARILGPLADTCLLVVRWEKTPREAALNAMRLISDTHTPVAGIALARADNERFRYYSYGYQNYYSYSKYYSG